MTKAWTRNETSQRISQAALRVSLRLDLEEWTTNLILIVFFFFGRLLSSSSLLLVAPSLAKTLIFQAFRPQICSKVLLHIILTNFKYVNNKNISWRFYSFHFLKLKRKSHEIFVF